jgi:hypothetical protein
VCVYKRYRSGSEYHSATNPTRPPSYSLAHAHIPNMHFTLSIATLLVALAGPTVVSAGFAGCWSASVAAPDFPYLAYTASGNNSAGACTQACFPQHGTMLAVQGDLVSVPATREIVACSRPVFSATAGARCRPSTASLTHPSARFSAAATRDSPAAGPRSTASTPPTEVSLKVLGRWMAYA